MIKISAATQKELVCLCGLCNHDCMDKKCPWNIALEKRNPEEETHKRILALMKKEILANINKNKGKTKSGRSGKKTKQE